MKLNNLKPVIVASALLCFTLKISAQIGIGVSGNVNSSAALEVSSTSKGFLPPRMTTTQRNSIVAPSDGLVIYNSTTNRLNIRDNSGWIEIGSLERSNTFSGSNTLYGTTTFNGKINVPMASIGFHRISGLSSNISATPWPGNTTTSTNWNVVNFPSRGSSIGNNSFLDSSNNLGARINYNNAGNGAAVIAYKGTTTKQFQINVTFAFQGSSSNGNNHDNVVFGLFKNNVLIPQSVFTAPNEWGFKTASIQILTSLSQNDFIDLRVIGFGGSQSTTVTIFSGNITAIGL